LPWLRLSVTAHRTFMVGMPDRAVTGGAAYDALVAATAAAHRVELVTCDRRALPVYERYGVRVQLL
jgi:predicted nucleic acid-binding protein